MTQRNDMFQTELYFEAHVTIDPVVFLDGSLQVLFEDLAKKYQFRVARLYMQKGSEFMPSDLDSFCTGRDVAYKPLLDRTAGLVKELQENNFTVKRYKIENTLLDVRLDKGKENGRNKI